MALAGRIKANLVSLDDVIRAIDRFHPRSLNESGRR